MLFLKKKEPERMTSTGTGFVPSDKVKEMSSRGFTEPEIIDILRKEGHSAEEIDKALIQALKSGVEENRQNIQFAPGSQEVTALPTLEDLPQQRQGMPAVPETTLPQEYYYQDPSPSEEYVNAIVGERMREVEQWIGEFSMKTNELEKRIGQIYDQISVLGQVKPSDQQLVLSKIDALKMTVDDVDTKLGSLERAFKETLPALIESVRALSDLVQRFKREA